MPEVDRWRVRIDWVFEHILRQGPNHCENAYIKDVLGRHLPHRFFDEAIRMNLEFDRNKLGNLAGVPK